MRFILSILFLVLSCSGCSSFIGDIKSKIKSANQQFIPKNNFAHHWFRGDVSEVSGKPGIKAGYSKVSITPRGGGQFLAGFYPTRMSTGVHDELWAHCLALEDGNGTRIAIVSVDLIGLLPSDVKDIKKTLSEIKRKLSF